MSGTTIQAQEGDRWNGIEGRAWVEYQPRYDAMLGELGRRALDAARLEPGQRVLDVGCGCGDTTLEASWRVGPEGGAVGADRSALMLQRARERVATLGLRNVEFVLTDAEVHRFPSDAFDAVISRFGIMLFTDPEAAFARIARTLRPGGRMSFVTWGPPMANAWFTLPLAAAGEHLDLSQVPAPSGPGPFNFADPELVHGILQGAGLVDVDATALDEAVWVGTDADDAAAFFAGANGHKIAPGAGADLLPQIASTLRDLLVPFEGLGGVHLPASAWLVTARAPG